MNITYTDMIAKFNIGSAHPGGLAVTKKIFETLKTYPHDHILDVGCGTGKTMDYLAKETNSQIIGIDRNPEMIKKAKERLNGQTNASVIPADIKHLPIKNSSIDCVLSESVTSFTHIPTSLQQYNRVLHDKGLLILLEMTAKESLTEEEKAEMQSFYEVNTILTEAEWKNTIEEAGFSLLGIETFSPETEGAIDLNLQQEIDPIYFEIMAQHYHIIEKARKKYQAQIYYCQKNKKEVAHAGS